VSAPIMVLIMIIGTGPPTIAIIITITMVIIATIRMTRTSPVANSMREN
jgi:hypothetical protein